MHRNLTIVMLVTIALSAASRIQAASVTFSPVNSISGTSTGAEVDNSAGTYQFAWNSGDAGTSVVDVAVNGVTFYANPTQSTPSGITLTASGVSQYVSNRATGIYGGGMFTMMDDAAITTNGGASPTFDVIFNGLTTGQRYRAQFLVQDISTLRNMSITSGADTTGGFGFGAAAGNGQYVFGKFTANAATQTFTINSVGERGFLNGISLFKLNPLYQITQNFNSDPTAGVSPTWSKSNTTDNGNNWGWSNTSNAGGAAGEVGGLFSRGPTNAVARFDTNVGALDPSVDNLSFSGLGGFTSGDAGTGNSILGWFSDSTSIAWVPANFIGIRTDENDVYLDYNYNGTGLVEVQLASGLTGGTPWTFNLTYNPDGNGGLGSLTGQVNSLTAQTLNLAAGVKDLFANLNRFGLLNLANGGSATKNVFYDSLVYTSSIAPVPEPSSAFLAVIAVPFVVKRLRPRRQTG